MIEVRQVTKKFGSIVAVNGISFSMSRGEVVGFLGPNGAGKTTTMRILTGFLPATRGECTIAGLDIRTDSLEIRKKIGYLPETTALYGDMEVTDYLKYLGGIRRCTAEQIKEGLREVVSVCGLKSVIGKKISTLSKGFKQRVALAQALLHKPEVLILDEPTVGLDPNQIREIRDLIKEIGKDRTILLSTHILSEVEQTCQRVIIISEGQIVGQGTPSELMLQTHGAPVYHLGLRAPEAEIEPVFSKLSGFQKVETHQGKEGCLQVQLLLEDQKDRSEEIFKIAVEKGWALVELKRESASLEDVFKKLTLS